MGGNGFLCLGGDAAHLLSLILWGAHSFVRPRMCVRERNTIAHYEEYKFYACIPEQLLEMLTVEVFSHCKSPSALSEDRLKVGVLMSHDAAFEVTGF